MRYFEYNIQEELKPWLIMALDLGAYRTATCSDGEHAVVKTTAPPSAFNKLLARAKALKYGEEHQCFAMTENEARNPEFRLSYVGMLQGAGITSYAVIED